MVVQRCNEVVNRAAKLGADASIDVDQLALRVTLDVIGLVSSHAKLTAVAQPKHTSAHLSNFLSSDFLQPVGGVLLVGSA
jgi:hypothetical protein